MACWIAPTPSRFKGGDRAGCGEGRDAIANEAGQHREKKRPVIKMTGLLLLVPRRCRCRFGPLNRRFKAEIESDRRLLGRAEHAQ